MTRYLLAALAVILLPLSALAQDKTFNAETFMLENGMQAVVIPNHRAPVVTHMVWYRVGAIDERSGESGLAHFVEHLMFKGTEKFPPGEFSKRVRAMGGNDNAFTGPDYTAYHQSIAADRLGEVMEMEADRMRGLTFPLDHVTSELQVVIEERRQRTENDPRARLYEQLRAVLFVNHPYGRPVLGWQHEVDTLNRDNVKNFYEKWYAPNNAILIVTGDITAEKLKPLAEKTYGKIARHEIPQRIWTTVPPLQGHPVVTLRDPAVRQPMTVSLCRVPSFAQDRNASLALQVFESVMDGGAATRLYKALVMEGKLATGVNLSYDGSALSDGTVSMSATPVDGVDLEKIEQGIDAELKKIIAEGVLDQELREAKDRMKDEAVLARDSLAGPAMIFGASLTTGSTVDDVEDWPAMIESVTAEQVKKAAADWLGDGASCASGHLLPEEKKE